MNVIKVRKQLELRGRDEQDLSCRIDNFRQALRAQKGAILGIKWRDGSPKRAPCVSIVYQIPLTSAEPEQRQVARTPSA